MDTIYVFIEDPRKKEKQRNLWSFHVPEQWVIQRRWDHPMSRTAPSICEMSAALAKIAEKQKVDYRADDFGFQYRELMKEWGPVGIIYVDKRYDKILIQEWIAEILESIQGRCLPGPKMNGFISFCKQMPFIPRSDLVAQWNDLSPRDKLRWNTPNDQYIDL